MAASTSAVSAPDVERTDLSRWRLNSHEGGGRHVWTYLSHEEAQTAEPQRDEEKYWLGIEVGAPSLPRATTPLDAARNGFAFYRRIQARDGHWAGDYGGPLFLMPGLVIGMYATGTPIPREWSIEMRRYLRSKCNEDGGWGLHIAGGSTVFGTATNYVTCRILGMAADEPVMVKARGLLHKLGGATGAPAWGKLWLAILGVYDWEGLHPVPPELWLLPDAIPIHPWRWWPHTRMVYLPMGYLWAKRFSVPLNPFLQQLREELYTQPYDTINWFRQRNNVAQVDIWAPHTRTLEALMGVLAGYEMLGPVAALREAGIRRAYEMVVMEDENTGYQGIGPVNKMLNYLVRWDVEGPDSDVMRQHREKLKDFMWMGPEGMRMTGTNGSQLWDTSFIAQALVDSGLVDDAENKAACARVLHWLDECQIRENPRHHKAAYRFATKGAWPFSTKEQGYTVSDCTAEGMKAVIMLQKDAGLDEQISEARLRDSVDLLLTMQNKSGGFASYETINGPKILEWINPAEVFGDIMIEYDYPECTTSVVTGLLKFKQMSDYRAADIDRCVKAAFKYIMAAQRPDGSWFGSWAVCFTYAMMFALESLHLSGQSCGNSAAVRRACHFLLSKQRADGGWGEAFESCVVGTYVQAKTSQVVQTSWAIIALLHAGSEDHEAIRRGVRLIMSRQQADGQWRDEDTVGVFNRNCSISYPNYVHSFTIWALGKAHRQIKGW